MIPSESLSRGTIQAIPREIAYSQKSIRLYGYYDNQDEASVEEWHNVKPCNNPMVNQHNLLQNRVTTGAADIILVENDRFS